VLRMRIDGSHNGYNMYGPSVSKTAHMDGSSPTFSAKKVASIEKWAKYKEDYHLRFKYTPKVVYNTILWGILVPIGAYYVVRSESMNRERENGRPNTKYFG